MSLYNCEVGFVKGMNLWVGLLLTLFGEECTFFMAQKLFYSGPSHSSPSFYSVKKLYTTSSAFLLENAFIHDQILQLWFPKLAQRLDRFEIRPLSYLEPWYRSLFVCCSSVTKRDGQAKNTLGGILPWPTLLRVWDVYLYYGWDILCLVSITILQSYQSALLNMDPATMSYFLGIEGASPEGVPINNLPTLSSSDKFMESLSHFYFQGKRSLLSKVLPSPTSQTFSESGKGSPFSFGSGSVDLSRLSGRELVAVFRDRYRPKSRSPTSKK